jgi:hypothetical protein
MPRKQNANEAKMTDQELMDLLDGASPALRAEVSRLKEELQTNWWVAANRHKEMSAAWAREAREQRDRAIAAEAEAERWKFAFAAQSRKLQAALNAGDETVRAAIMAAANGAEQATNKQG